MADKTNGVAFNSLYEIHYMCKRKVHVGNSTFNSLYEIPRNEGEGGGRLFRFFQFSLWDSPGLKLVRKLLRFFTFNSLYEILGRWMQCKTGSKVYLSILFMRFWEKYAGITKRRSGLSILFMRFRVLYGHDCWRRVWNLSILFMRFFEDVWDYGRVDEWSFQFSLWDSYVWVRETFILRC